MDEGLNGSGVKDPTAFVALRNMGKRRRPYMPRVYICASPRHERERLASFCRYAIGKGFSPFCRGLMYGDITTEDIAAHMGCLFMDCCTQVWVFGESTPQMRRELARARAKGKPVRHFSEDCMEVYGE